MIELTVEDVAKFHENIVRWLRNKDAAAIYAEFPFLHAKPYPALRHRTFFDYTRQPVDELQYGVEIELDLEYTNLMVLPDLRHALSAGIHQCLWQFGLLQHGVSIQKDESLNEGMELVLPPMPVSMLRTVLTKLYKVHGMQFVRNHLECGVHITTDPFPDKKSAIAFWNFWQNPRLYDGSMRGIAGIIGREPTRHCSLQGAARNLTQIKKICKAKRGAVVLRNSGCMEVRVFASVINAKKVFKQVQLVDAVYRLCVQHKSDMAVLPLIRKAFNKKVNEI